MFTVIVKNKRTFQTIQYSTLCTGVSFDADNSQFTVNVTGIPSSQTTYSLNDFLLFVFTS